jgi:eukaryotic-like serine/threonine-protein kinase
MPEESTEPRWPGWPDFNSPASGAPLPLPYEDTPRLGSTAHTASFPTVFGAGVTMTSVGDPLVGHSLDGRYEIVERLARGGMATVYKAIDTRLTRTVAVKVMHVGLGDDAEFAHKFDREARAAARLSHPCVVSVFDQGQDVGRPYIVMEYVEGHTLRDLISREAPLTPLRALEVIEPILSALATAHEAGLVHRDVKPENVLISTRGQIKVADFGLAKAVTSQTSTATQGLLIGTVSYLPPELVLSGRADARSDVYSAGIVLFELLTGVKPHTGETPIQVAYAHVHKDVPPPSTCRTAGPIPPYLDALIARATARDPDLRPHDAKVLLTQVRRVRSALREGLADDPELTQDLSGLLMARRDESAEPTRTRADFEVTQLVATTGLAPSHPMPDRFAEGPTDPMPQRLVPYRTVLDAPPPAAPARAYQVSPEHLAATRDRRVRARRRGWIALLIVLILTTAATLTGWYLTEGRFTTAPALEMLSKDEAATVASKAKLQIQFDTAYSETIAAGLVTSTDPAAGSRILSGGDITAYVSKGPERYSMPTVAGLSQDAAVDALQNAHLVVGKVREHYSETVAKGLVIEASYARGQLLKPQTPVNLTVSQGPAPIKVANYEGKDAAKAIAALKKAGFEVKVDTENSDTVAKDLVIAQNPKSGTGVKGDEISLTQSLGPVLVTVPTVRGMGTKAAVKVMEAAGFKTRVRPAAINYLGVGYVVTSSPKARSQAPKGSTITLYVI